jgi:hypothetical protein
VYICTDLIITVICCAWVWFLNSLLIVVWWTLADERSQVNNSFISEGIYLNPVQIIAKVGKQRWKGNCLDWTEQIELDFFPISCFYLGRVGRLIPFTRSADPASSYEKRRYGTTKDKLKPLVPGLRGSHMRCRNLFWGGRRDHAPWSDIGSEFWIQESLGTVWYDTGEKNGRNLEGF